MGEGQADWAKNLPEKIDTSPYLATLRLLFFNGHFFHIQILLGVNRFGTENTDFFSDGQKKFWDQASQ